MAVTGQDVADFLGRGDETALVQLAGQHVQIVTALARSYTRGRGFDEFGAVDDVAAVITTATARLVDNPAQAVREKVGAVEETHTPFLGWTLAETFVLNRYRVRAR